MKYVKDIKKFVNGKHVFCGIDVHFTDWVVCFLCDGLVVEKIRISGDYINLKKLLMNYKDARKISCVYEAGFSGFWLYRRLQADGYNCIITPPSLIPQTGSKVKTDKLDAEKLAAYLSAGILKSIWVPPAKVESDRRICRRRAQLVKMQTRAKCQIRAYLNTHGIKQPAEIKLAWSQKYILWLQNLTFTNESDKFTFAILLKNYCRLREDILEVQCYLQSLARSSFYQKNYSFLTSVRGVGLITAMTFLLEIYDFGRFSTSSRFSSYLGLTPAQYSSGEHTRLGHITRQGNSQLRRVLVESAWTVIKHDPHLRAKYDRLKAKGTNGKKAIVAVARSLAVRLRRILLDQTEYVVGVC